MVEEQEVAPEVEATKEDVADQPKAVDPDVVEPETEQPEREETAQEAPDAPQEAEGKPPSRHQRRKAQMDKLRAENEALETKYREAQERLKRIDEASQQMAPPKEADFESFEEYQAALSAHHAMRAMDSRQRSEIEREAKAHQDQIEQVKRQREQEIAQNWAAQMEEARTRYADFDQVALTAPISDPVAHMVAQMDAAADVAYHLGLNPADARRVSSLSPLEAAMELGRIEARLQAPKPKTVTNAPDPVAPVRPKAGAGKNPDEMTPEEYDKWRESGGTFSL